MVDGESTNLPSTSTNGKPTCDGRAETQPKLYKKEIEKIILHLANRVQMIRKKQGGVANLFQDRLSANVKPLDSYVLTVRPEFQNSVESNRLQAKFNHVAKKAKDDLHAIQKEQADYELNSFERPLHLVL